MRLRQLLVHLNGLLATVVTLHLVSLSKMPQQRNEVPLLPRSLIFSPILLLLRSCLLHMYQVSSNLLACALAAAHTIRQALHHSVDVGSGSFHLATRAASESRLLPSSSHEVLVDVLCLEGRLDVVLLLLDRRADRERLDDGVADDVRLIEEAGVAADHAAAGTVGGLGRCVVLLLVVSVSACCASSWLAAGDEVLRGGGCSAAS